LHHLHDLVHGHVITLTARRTLPCRPHFLQFLEELRTVTVVLEKSFGANRAETQKNGRNSRKLGNEQLELIKTKKNR